MGPLGESVPEANCVGAMSKHHLFILPDASLPPFCSIFAFLSVIPEGNLLLPFLYSQRPPRVPGPETRPAIIGLTSIMTSQ